MKIDVTNVTLSTIYRRQNVSLRLKALIAQSASLLLVRYLMATLIKKRYYTRQPCYSNLRNNVFINGPRIQTDVYRASSFSASFSFQTRVLHANRSLSAFARHDANEVTAPTNCAISLNLGGTEYSCPRSQCTLLFTSKNEKEKARKKREKNRKRETEMRELLIRRRARIPCRCMYRTLWLWLCEVLYLESENAKRDGEKEKGRGSTRASLTGRVN